MYLSGYTLFQECLYNEALIVLRRAEDAFAMRADTLFAHPLSNGISGLANTFILSGFCYQKLGNFKAALTCFETSLINAKFEKKKASRDFTKTFTENLIVCYENVLKTSGDGRRDLTPGIPQSSLWFYYPLPLFMEILTVSKQLLREGMQPSVART